MSEKYVYRVCPCDRCDIEGIQSWLEDLAAQGLLLAEDDVFCGVFSFVRRSPQKVTYRLDVAQKRKPRFMDSDDSITDEELALYRSMGWEYLLRYGDFRVYRSVERDAPELNTEGKTHAITVSLLKKKHRSSFLSAALLALFWQVCSHGFLRYGFRMAAVLGLVFTLCLYGFMLWNVIVPLLRAFRFRRYEKRLLDGDSLNHRAEWKKTAPIHFGMRVLPVLLCLGIAAGLLSALIQDSATISHEEYPGTPPFATAADVFPNSTISEDQIWLDYGTYKTGETSVSKNIEWNESCDVKAEDGKNYFCILRLSYHETVSAWFAGRLEKDYYVYDANRYHGKRFQDLTAPDLGVDSIRVYSSYGTLHVLMREENRVVHAVVTIDDNSQNHWLLWAQAMADALKK